MNCTQKGRHLPGTISCQHTWRPLLNTVEYANNIGDSLLEEIFSRIAQFLQSVTTSSFCEDKLEICFIIFVTTARFEGL